VRKVSGEWANQTRECQEDRRSGQEHKSLIIRKTQTQTFIYFIDGKRD